MDMSCFLGVRVNKRWWVSSRVGHPPLHVIDEESDSCDSEAGSRCSVRSNSKLWAWRDFNPLGGKGGSSFVRIPTHAMRPHAWAPGQGDLVEASCPIDMRRAIRPDIPGSTAWIEELVVDASVTEISPDLYQTLVDGLIVILEGPRMRVDASSLGLCFRNEVQLYAGGVLSVCRSMRT